MGKVAIDFKINNTHNNTGQLFDFHLPFHYFMPLSPHSWQHFSSDSSSPCKCSLSFFFFVVTLITPRPVSAQLSSFSLCLFHWCISKIDPLWRKSAPEHWGHMCVADAAAASQLALLAAPCLYPVVCQAAKQGKRWDKWLFMICHLPSSQLSPGPIYYSCRLPLCGRKHAHTQMPDTVTCVHTCTMLRQTNTHISHSLQLKATYLMHSLLSCRGGNQPNFAPSLRSKDIIPFSTLWKKSDVTLLPFPALQ